MNADLGSYREHICTMYHPFIVIGHNFHLIMNAFKNKVGNNAVNTSLSRLHKINILRTDHYVYRLILSETFVHTGEIHTQDLHKTVLHHSCRNNIALPDKICHKSIFRLVVDLLRRTDLLNIPLVHYHDSI